MNEPSRLPDIGSPDTSREGGTVLVVEDEPNLRGMAAETLRLAGYEVLECSNAAEALAVCEESGERLDLVLADVMLPGMDGVELCRRIGEAHPHVALLLTSGYSGDVLNRNGLAGSGAAFLAKPYRPAALKERVGRIMRARAAGLRVLIAGPDSAVVRALAKFLRDSGFLVDESSLDLAARKAARASCRAIIVDTGDGEASEKAFEALGALGRPAKGILVASPGGTVPENCSGWTVLRRPVRVDDLLDAVKKATSGPDLQCRG